MRKVLVVYAHPGYANSRISGELISQIKDLESVTISNLYQKYPNEKINVVEEQKLLLQHDLIILQFPFSWYNTTPLMKKWIDEVFTFGFAYGEGSKLNGKSLMLCITLGTERKTYPDVLGITLAELLKPFEYTAKYCNMQYRDPFVVTDPTASQSILKQQSQAYSHFLKNYIANGESAFSSIYPSYK